MLAEHQNAKPQHYNKNVLLSAGSYDKFHYTEYHNGGNVVKVFQFVIYEFS